MHTNTKIRAAALIASALVAGAASFAQAQEVTAEADVEVSIQSTTSTPRPPIRPLRPQPLMDLRDDARERIIELREGMQDRRIEVRAEMQSATSGEERRSIIREAREDREEMRDRAQEIRGNIKERLQALVRTHVGAVVKRSENALNMFDNLVNRMESRIDKLKERGADTASVEASLSSSVSLIATAKADLGALQTLVASVKESSDPATVKTQIRTAIEKVTASIKAAHASLLATARSLAQLSASVSAEVETGN